MGALMGSDVRLTAPDELLPVAGVAHPSGVMPRVKINDVVLVSSTAGLANAEAGRPQKRGNDGA